MTYNNGKTLQRGFVTGKYTLTALLAGSSLIWLASMLFCREATSAAMLFSFGMPVWLSDLASFAVYVLAAVIINSFVVLEGRVSWLGGLYMWLSALSFSLVSNIQSAVSALMLVLLYAVVLSCYQRENVQKWVFTSSALLASFSLLEPRFLYLLPVCLIYWATTSVLGLRNILAALFGLITPFWLYCGVVLLQPDYNNLLPMVPDRLYSLFNGCSFALSLPVVPHLAVELLILLITTSVFVQSTTPAKPIMRKMFAFFVFAGYYLLFLSLFRADDFSLLFAWRLPGIAIMVAFLFSVKFNKSFNLLFVFINVLWLLLAGINITYGFLS